MIYIVDATASCSGGTEDFTFIVIANDSAEAQIIAFKKTMDEKLAEDATIEVSIREYFSESKKIHTIDRIQNMYQHG